MKSDNIVCVQYISCSSSIYEKLYTHASLVLKQMIHLRAADVVHLSQLHFFVVNMSYVHLQDVVTVFEKWSF